MPSGRYNSARSMGYGFWGLLIGGGPWGQPCHQVHHLFPGLAWYNQLRMHNRFVRALTQEQKERFLLPGLLGFPKLIRYAYGKTYEYSRRAEA
jgi:fatty acid desaturase